MTPTLPTDWYARQKSTNERDEAALQAAWGADADQLTHEQPEIEAANVDQQPLQDVGVPAQVDAAHAAGFVEMGKGPLQAFTAEPQQTQAPRPRMRRRLRYTAARAAGFFFQFRRPRSGSEM